MNLYLMKTNNFIDGDENLEIFNNNLINCKKENRLIEL